MRSRFELTLSNYAHIWQFLLSDAHLHLEILRRLNHIATWILQKQRALLPIFAHVHIDKHTRGSHFGRTGLRWCLVKNTCLQGLARQREQVLGGGGDGGALWCVEGEAAALLRHQVLHLCGYRLEIKCVFIHRFG